MASPAANRRKAERQYMRRTVRASLFIAVPIFIGICLLIMAVPSIKASRIEGWIRMGEYEKALSAISQLENANDALRLRNEAELVMARDMMERGEYEAARSALMALGDYGGAKSLADECAYLRGEELYAQGDMAAAQKMYLLIPDYPGAADRIAEYRYGEALKLIGDDKIAAWRALKDLDGYADSASLMGRLAMEITGENDEQSALAAMETLSEEELSSRAAMAQTLSRLRQGALAVGGYHTLGLRSDGTVLSAGRDDAGQCEVDSWTGVIQIAAGVMHSVGLRSDGTVVAAGDNSCGQCDVASWTDVVEIACGDWATFALFSDGTVAAAGYLDYDGIAAWRGVTHISAGAYMAAGIYGGGEAYLTHPSAECADFHGLTDVALVPGGALGLRQDGSVTANFDSFPGWTDVACVSAGSLCVLGIRSDGALLAHFFRSGDAFEIDNYTDVLAVAGGGGHSAIMTRSGQVRAFGNNDYGQCDIGWWELGE